MRDQRFVGRRHRIVAQFGRPHPFELLSFPCLDEPFPASANIERHEQVEVKVEMARKGQGREALLLDGYSKFLPQLSNQALFGPFAGLDLAARKLPQYRHRLARRTLCDEHAAIGIDQRAGGDKDKSEAHGRSQSKEWRVKAYSIKA